MITDPRTAPARTDLPFLRHRRRPAAPPPEPPAARPAPVSAPTPVPTPTAAPSVSAPAGASGSSLLDLSHPARPPLGSREAPSTRPTVAAPPPPAPPPAVARRSERPSLSPHPPADGYRPARLSRGAPTLLTRTSPTVTLTRVQSGVGVLTIEAACSAAVGDLRLGCAFTLRSGVSSVVQNVSGITTGPPRSRRPLLIADREEYERLRLDLVQVRDLDRLVVYAFSESGAALSWGGTLVASTFAQDRMKVGLDRAAAPGVLVMLSVYVIDGELVIRNENSLVPGSVRDACLAFDFGDITWVDDRTPLT